jgi:hypothetical protein
VLVRQTAVAAYHRRPVPQAYSHLCHALAEAADLIAAELSENRMAAEARDPLLAVGHATGEVERSEVLAAEVILAQLRSIIVDLLLMTGLDQMESTDALPPPPR